MRWLLAFLAFLFVAAPAAATERVHHFHSELRINKDGSLDVTETISVNSEGFQIKRGIFREIPTRYTDRFGKQTKIGFEVVGVRRNGADEPYDIEPMSNGVRIRIGSADVFLPNAMHTYEIRYRTTRHIGFFEDYDELYWNVTGTDWRFWIDRASAVIILPEGASFGDRAVYTGQQGARGSAATVAEERPGYIRFETTSRLPPNHGLTIAAAFSKGIVSPPTDAQKLQWWLNDLAPPLAAILGLGGLLAFLYTAWKRAGRDPPKGTVVPIFTPPDNMTASEMRYVRKQKLDNRGFAAGLVDAAVRGHVRLVEEKGGLLSSKKKFIERPAGLPSMPLEPGMAKALTVLTSPGDRIEMDKENHSKFSAAKSNLEGELKRKYDGKAFNRNTGWALAALGLWFLVTTLVAGAAAWSVGAFPLYVILAPVLLILVGAMVLIASPQQRFIGCFLKVGGVVAIGIGGFLGLAFVPAALMSGNWLAIIISLVGLPLALSAFFWIDAPTKSGRALLDKIAGFEQYLSITEQERLDRMHAPKDTLDVFERFLPYAIALGVENRWADRFSSQLAAAATAASQSGSHFAWYSGGSDPWNNTGGFVNSIGSSLSSSISSASTAPGSSSGSGGGGSSGGGGGGGGGGGW